MSMKKEFKNNLEKIIDYAKIQGADASDAILNTGSSFSISAQNNEIDKYKISGSSVIGIRVIKDNKVGLSYTESMDADSLKLAAKNAVENAMSSDVNEFETITFRSDKDLIDESKIIRDEISTKDKIDFCLKLESEVKARDSRVQAVPYNGLSEAESATYYLNSLGTFGYDSEAYTSCYTSALINEGTKNSMHYHGSMGRQISELNVEECISESLEHASNWLDAEPVTTGKYDLFFTPDVFTSFFHCFGNIFSAKAAWDKTNPFREKIGQKVAIDELTVIDVPNYQDAFFKHKFDSEGVTRSDLTLIENGVMKNLFHNSSTANYFKTQTTGHASRGPKSGLGVSGTNGLIMPGKTSDSTITNGEYLEVHSVQGLHSGASAISGEFSLGASGYLCRDGKRIQPVKNITVAGNYHHMLMNIKAIGDKIYANGDKGFFAPRIRFDQLSVAGK